MRQETILDARLSALQIVPCCTESCMDPHTLNSPDQAFSLRFFEQLRSGASVRLNFQADAAQEAGLLKLNHLKTDTDRTSFTGFGYPMMLHGHIDQKEWVATPLFIWEIQFVKKEKGEWVLKTNGNSCAMLNTELFGFLENLYGEDYIRQIDQFIQQEKARPAQLLEFCHQLAERKGIQNDQRNWQLKKALTLSDLVEMPTEEGIIHPSGIFAVFEEKNCLSVNTLGLKPKEEASPKPPSRQEKTDSHQYSALQLSPSQQLVFHSIGKHQNLSIKGIKKAEQVILMTALASNQLANQQKCLIVLENEEIAQNLRQQLQQLGIYDLCLDMTIPANTHRALSQLLKPQNKKNNHDANQYQVALRSCDHWIAQFQKEKKALNEKVSEGLTWRDLLAKYLNCQEDNNGELLAPFLNPWHFRFSSEELSNLTNSLGESKALYQPLFVLNHPLDELHPDIFIEKYYDEAEDFCNQQIQKHKKALIQVIHELIKGQEAYRWKLKNKYEAFYQQTERQSLHIIHFIENHLAQYGSKFSEISPFGNARLKIQGVFSNKKKSLLKNRKEVARLYEEIYLNFKAFLPFEFQFPKPVGNFDFVKILAVLKDYRVALGEWRERFPHIVEAETTNLKSSDSLKEHGDFLELPKLEKAFEDILYQLNAAKLFLVQFDANHEYYHEKIEFLQSVVNYLEKADHALRDFPDFFEWKKRWYTLDSLNKEVLNAIISARPLNWHKAFKQWYWQQAVKRHALDDLPYQKSALNDFIPHHEKLIAQITGHIMSHWKQQRKKVLATFKKEQKERYQRLFSLIKESTEGMLITQRVLPLEFDFLNKYYPIWLLSAEHLTTVFPEEQAACFDLAIFDHPLMLEKEILPQAKCQAIFKQTQVQEACPAPKSSAALAEAIARRLGKEIPSKRIQTGVPLIKDFNADILITPLSEGRPPIVIQIDGIADAANGGIATCLATLAESELHYVESWSQDWWKDAERETGRLLGLIEGFDIA